MTARVLDGTETARQILEELRPRVAALVGEGRTPGLGVVLVGEDPGSKVYVRRKTGACEDLGIYHETTHLSASASTEEIERIVRSYNADGRIHGILVQTPLPKQVDATRILSLVDPLKDVDGFHAVNVGLLVQKRPRFTPCTPAGIMELLRRYNIDVRGLRAVVVGRSDIVGKPMALALLHADATVTVAHSKTKDLPEVTRQGDLLVAAIGRAGAIDVKHVKPGAVVVDVGMNRIEDPSLAASLLGAERLEQFKKRGHALVGDVRYPTVREVASAITPVPGGVGPLTIAMLLKNTVDAASRRG